MKEMMARMSNVLKPEKDSYSEQEAAEALNISIERLHLLLDQNIFNDGSKRPQNIILQAQDVILIEFWHRTTHNDKILKMPRR